MTIIKYILVAAVAFSAMGSHTVMSADPTDDVDSVRCGNQLVTVGDRQFTVAEKCGEPNRIQGPSYGGTEVWVYNFGPREFIRYLSFVNGRLYRIQVGGYGW
jgi:hypothetical protein